MLSKLRLPLLLLLTLLAGCATNPVTGKYELMLVSESTELEIGREQYFTSRQMQGGDFKLDPKLAAYVSQVGRRLARVSDRKLPYEFTIINDSTPNAWSLPGGKIAVNRGLLWELGSEAELAAVLSHEIVHAAARHGAQGLQRGLLLQGVLVAAGTAIRDSDYSQLAVDAAAIGANLLNQGYSRDAEREADEYGMLYMARAGYDPSAAVALQETFVRLNKERRSNWLTGLFASHPPSTERVARNRETAARLGLKGERGERRYRQMTAYLRKLRPAYEAYDAGRKALAGGKRDEALRLAEKAIRLAPEEALFHGLKGDVLAQRQRYRDAIAAYDQAISLDRDFFRYYLRRGQVRAELGEQSGARRDLERSLKLLPTADAHYQLGQMALRDGDQRSAISHFKSASDSRSPSGELATRELVRIELPENPNKYLKIGLGARQGWLVVQVTNTSPLEVERVQIMIGREGRRGSLRYRVKRPIPPGGRVNVVTDIRLVKQAELKQWRAIVRRADVAE